MKTEEFVDKLESLDCKVTIYDTVIDVSVKGKHFYNPIAQISREVHCRVETNYNEAERLTDERRNELYSIIFEYALTPIEEREETKKYYLRLPDFVSSDRYCYLNYKERNKHYLFSSDEECEYYQSKFTQEEIDAMPNQEFIKTLIKEEVQK